MRFIHYFPLPLFLLLGYVAMAQYEVSQIENSNRKSLAQFEKSQMSHNKLKTFNASEQSIKAEANQLINGIFPGPTLDQAYLLGIDSRHNLNYLPHSLHNL